MRNLTLLFVGVSLVLTTSAFGSGSGEKKTPVGLNMITEEGVIRAEVVLSGKWKMTDAGIAELTLVHPDGGFGNFRLSSDGEDMTTMALLWGSLLTEEGCETTVRIEKREKGFGNTYVVVRARCPDSESVAAFRTCTGCYGIIFTSFGSFPKDDIESADLFLESLNESSLKILEQ